MADDSAVNDELRPHYDDEVFDGAVRGKYAERYAKGTNIVRLAPEVAAAFPTEQAVNDALRLIQQIAHDTGQIVAPH